MVNSECEKRRPLSVVLCPLFLLHRPSPAACRSGQLTTDQGPRTNRTKDVFFAFTTFTIHHSSFILPPPPSGPRRVLSRLPSWIRRGPGGGCLRGPLQGSVQARGARLRLRCKDQSMQPGERGHLPQLRARDGRCAGHFVLGRREGRA